LPGCVNGTHAERPHRCQPPVATPNSRRPKRSTCTASTAHAEAARRTNIPVTTISAWAYRSGTRTDAPQRTRAAVEAAKANADARRQQLRQEILDSAIEAAQRIREPYKTHVGQQGKEVILTRPPADMVRNLMTAAAIGWDKETVAAGGVSDRKGPCDR
jgi:hypothetical protein